MALSKAMGRAAGACVVCCLQGGQDGCIRCQLRTQGHGVVSSAGVARAGLCANAWTMRRVAVLVTGCWTECSASVMSTE